MKRNDFIMEEIFKQILNKLDTLETKIDTLEKKEQENFDHLAKKIFETSVRLEDKIDNGLQRLDFKLNEIYINTSSIAKQFTDTTKQELPVLRSRQIEHSNQLEDHEERISKLEAIE
jgi:hypothetical protein